MVVGRHRAQVRQILAEIVPAPAQADLKAIRDVNLVLNVDAESIQLLFPVRVRTRLRLRPLPVDRIKHIQEQILGRIQGAYVRAGRKKPGR